MNEAYSRRWFEPVARQFVPLIVVAGTLLLLGFYTVTDAARLSHDHVLDGADYVGYAVCHRITDRSFTIAGRQLPLCARCTGIYLGVTLSFLVLGLSGRRRWSDMPPLPILAVLGSFIALMGIDGANSYSHFFPNFPHIYEPRNWLRLITGMGAGLTMGIILFPALAQTLWRDQVKRPVLVSFRELIGLLMLAAVTIVLVLSNQPTVLYVLGLASAAGVLIVLTSVNSVMLLILLKRDALAVNWRQALAPIATGLALAIGQVAVVSFARLSITGTMTGFPGL